MHLHSDPQTAMTLARYARTEQIHRVAEHRRYLEGTQVSHVATASKTQTSGWVRTIRQRSAHAHPRPRLTTSP